MNISSIFQVMEDLNLNPDEIMFGQGTLRPDLIESASGLASGHADLIKTHHNDTELVRQLRAKQKVVEPLTEFHKDEVKYYLVIFYSKFLKIIYFFRFSVF